MDRRDILVMGSIMLGAGIPVTLMILVANGIIKLPLSNLGTN
ncbi:hypothetical protein N9M35_03845 [Nitrosopumilus sp.]|jgi:hypothetical protein|nr:hypothetical protein [Nitrosopumilus sp.]|tara:strand:- start:239 stop:364 length:126 start_codon:yes stop_codon:yes gene_type:complete